MNIKNGMLSGLLLLLTSWLHAQVTLALEVPPTGVMQKSQLWNMVLVNGGNAAYEVDVTVTLLSTSDNNPVLTAVSRLVTLTKGAHQLKYADFSPVSYKYLSSAFNADMRPEGFIPVGSYTVCYTVSRWVGDLPETLAEECIALEIQPLSPPVLNMPEDGSVVETRSPQFSWLPPTPMQLFGDLSYDMVIAKVGIGQSPLSAIQQNIPVYNVGRGRNNFLNYPASSGLLDTGVTYAWCVIARNNNQFIAQSDVWTFKVSNNQPEWIQSEGASYVRLKRYGETALALCTGDINIEYTHMAEGTVVNYTIRSAADGKSGPVYQGTFPVTAGQNFLTLPAQATRKLDENKYYILELYNARNEKWGTRFSYRKKSR